MISGSENDLHPGGAEELTGECRYSLMRCFSSQTRNAASKRLFVRVSVPTAAGSRTTFPCALLLRGRPRRAFVEPERRAAVSLRGR